MGDGRGEERIEFFEDLVEHVNKADIPWEVFLGTRLIIMILNMNTFK